MYVSYDEGTYCMSVMSGKIQRNKEELDDEFHRAYFTPQSLLLCFFWGGEGGDGFALPVYYLRVREVFKACWSFFGVLSAEATIKATMKPPM